MELVVLIAIPGSGKTTYYRQEYAATHLHLNLDQLNNNRNRQQLLFYAGLAGKTKMVIDSCNVTAAGRAGFIMPAKAAGYMVKGVVIYTPVAEALRRNAGRDGKARVPEKGVLSFLGRFQHPSLAEGFDELLWLNENFEPVTPDRVRGGE